ncbi:glycosyltransferase family 61 protein [Aurantiacibacter poecillastricola]|uniref:glycosyltransferase family 61 protein n=1 Tax=Aurantiacibacter poecillastricola TaxID=3064385 RepID=UPI00274008D7|nr:glycosyltransferase family 61 protein [Aurantiacibacter sp. 219JJ12-13]MDP5263215.1 glycosyltransferase family 61 protein [Aurantiacibacter sp. 219JJ12-13]
MTSTTASQTSSFRSLSRRAYWSAIWHMRRMPERAVRLGLPPAILGNQFRRREPLQTYVEKHADAGLQLETLYPARQLSNPLPRNVEDRESLSRDGALWGYSIWDVPERKVAATQLATLRDCRFQFFDTPQKGDFFPALLSPGGVSIEAREISYRPGHAKQSDGGQVVHRDRATWMIERAYHNHSHWLTAHLPKLILLRDRPELSDLILPSRRTDVVDASMRMLGLEPEDFESFEADKPLHVDDLTLVQADRFDPLHMQAVRTAFANEDSAPPTRKVLISRANSRGRKLLNEEKLWPMLREAGFERILMEDLDFAEQVRLMQETRILMAPHGAGLTNMLFCPPGGHVVELADPGFPNPNFYALSCALDLDYWLVPAKASKAAHPLDRDLQVDIGEVAKIVDLIG